MNLFFRHRCSRSIVASLVLWLSLLLSLLMPSAYAAEKPVRPSLEKLTRLPLASLMTEHKPIRLTTAAGQYELSLPVAKRVKILNARLHLDVTNSISLIGERSQLAVRINDYTVAQLALDPGRQRVQADIELPLESLEPGYNVITFAAAQHYTYECEDPSAPELWTEINPMKSYIELATELRPLELNLSALDDVFDPKLPGKNQIKLLTVSEGEVSEAQLLWGALLAQGVALRYRYVQPEIIHQAAALQDPSVVDLVYQNFPALAQEELRGSDNIFVGTKEQIAAYVSPDIVARISGSYLGVFPLDAAPGRFVVVVSGTTDNEVSEAARAFALINFPYPDTSDMVIASAEYPVLRDYARARRVHQDTVYSFSELGLKTTTVNGGYKDLLLEIDLPPDLYAAEDSMVELDVHLSYGAAMRADSVLNLHLNGQFERVIPFDEVQGVVYPNYKIGIPLRSFKPGYNVISFSSRMVPMVSGKCQPVQTENLLLTIYDDSTLTLPAAAHFVSLPNLRLFAHTGFPYIVAANGSDVAMYVAANDTATVSAAWTLAAKLAQRYALPLTQMEISYQMPSTAANVIVVGALDALDSKVLRGAPIKFEEQTRVPYPSVVMAEIGEEPPRWWQRMFDVMPDFFQLQAADKKPQHAYLSQLTNGLGGYTLAMQYESPIAQGTTLTVFVADASDTLYEGMLALAQPAIWDNLRGDLTLWGEDVESLGWQKVGPSYEVGEVDVGSWIEYYFSHHPWLWLVSIVIILLLFALFSVALLRHYRRKHLAGVEETTNG